MRASNYGIKEILMNVFFVLKTNTFFHGARMIRFPIIIRGKKYIDFGRKLTTGYNCRFEVNGIHQGKRLVFGKNVNIGDNVRISCCDSVEIGSNVLIGSRVLIIDNSHGSYTGNKCDSPAIPPNQREIKSSPIVIEDNVWIGEGAVIQQGVTIGQGSIIGANSVVTSNVPNNCICAGMPAKVIKHWNEKDNRWNKV